MNKPLLISIFGLLSIVTTSYANHEFVGKLTNSEYRIGFDTSFFAPTSTGWKPLPIPVSFGSIPALKTYRGTLTLRYTLPSSDQKALKHNETLAVRTGIGSEIAGFYVNSYKICSIGSLFPYQAASESEKICIVPTSYFSDSTKNHLFVVYTILDKTLFHGIRTPASIDVSYEIFRSYYSEMITPLFLCGGFILMALFFLLLGILRPKETYNLYFGFLSIFFCIFMSTNTSMNTLLYVNNHNLVVRLDIISGIATTIFAILFLTRLLSHRISMLPRATSVFLCCMAVSCFFIDEKQISVLRQVWYLVVFCTVPFAVGLCVHHIRKNNATAQYIFIGMILFFSSSFYDLLAFSGYAPFFFTLPYAFIILMTTTMILLIRRFIAVHVKLEQLTVSLEERVISRTQALELALQDKDKLISIVAHDLKNPVGSIAGVCDLLMEEPSITTSHQTCELVSLIDQACNQAQSIITDILVTAREKDAQEKLSLTQVNLASLVQSESELFHTRLEEKHITLRIQPPHTPITIPLHVPSCTRILDNLISNAIKFTPLNGSITIAIIDNKKTVSIAVTDSGIGIPKDKLPFIFDRFTSAGRSGTNSEASTGIGLSIVKELVARRGGTIVATSIEGKGTTMLIELPLEPNKEDTNCTASPL